MNPLWHVADFVWRLRLQMRFGELSRAPLKLLRLELRGTFAECEWMARPADPWDADIDHRLGERNQTLQALRDAMAVRELLFRTLPEVRTAEFRVYRQSARGSFELIISGTVAREDEAPPKVASMVMRAKLYGFNFCLEDGVLEALQTDEHTLEFAT